jgi:hypothetical protein
VSRPGVVRPAAGTLEASVFRDLYPRLDLHNTGGVHVAVPKGTPVFTGSTLTAVVWAIGGHSAACPRGTGWPTGGTR